MKMNEDGKTVAAMDCLVPGIGEIIGGSQREDNLREVRGAYGRAWTQRKRTTVSIWICVNTVPPATPDFGLGFERCVMYLTGVSNIRDVIPFPRTVNNCEL